MLHFSTCIFSIIFLLSFLDMQRTKSDGILHFSTCISSIYLLLFLEMRRNKSDSMFHLCKFLSYDFSWILAVQKHLVPLLQCSKRWRLFVLFFLQSEIFFLMNDDEFVDQLSMLANTNKCVWISNISISIYSFWDGWGKGGRKGGMGPGRQHGGSWDDAFGYFWFTDWTTVPSS